MILTNEGSSQLKKVKEIKEAYHFSYHTLYGLIKSDPTFPCLNIGPKKNYRIQRDLFVQWLKERCKDRQSGSFQIPTAEELLKSVTSGGKK